MQKAIEQKSRWYWLNQMVDRGLVAKEKAIKLKRNIASGAVVYNPLVGLISKTEEDNLVRDKILARMKDGTWAIPVEETIKSGKKVLIVSKKFSEWDNRKRALAGAAHYNKESFDSLLKKEDEKEIEKLLDNF